MNSRSASFIVGKLVVVLNVSGPEPDLAVVFNKIADFVSGLDADSTNPDRG